MVVDDEKDVLLILEKILTAEGYSVITATNGVDALTLAKSKTPDLVILDIVMPGMEGGQVAEWLKTNPDTMNIPVIFLTALLSRSEEYKEDHRIGGNITFAKPFDTEELLIQIKILLCSVTVS